MVHYNEAHGEIIESLRKQIWELYQDLKAYRQQPEAAQKKTLEARFDALCNQRTGYPSINAVLKEIRVHKTDLLRVLERPEVPLHNNAEESDIREYVKKRKSSGGGRTTACRSRARLKEKRRAWRGPAYKNQSPRSLCQPARRWKPNPQTQ